MYLQKMFFAEDGVNLLTEHINKLKINHVKINWNTLR